MTQLWCRLSMGIRHGSGYVGHAHRDAEASRRAGLGYDKAVNLGDRHTWDKAFTISRQLIEYSISRILCLYLCIRQVSETVLARSNVQPEKEARKIEKPLRSRASK